jgi:dihydropteroate synthase
VVLILARPICLDRPDDLALAFARMALPGGARAFLFDKILHVQVLLTGMEDDDRRLLRTLTERDSSYSEEFPAFVVGDRRRPGTALLSGRRDQLERLSAATRPSRPGLAGALDRMWKALEAPEAIELGGRRLEFGARTFVMGVVNVTPDSFSDGGRFLSADAAIAQGEALARAGADVLDIGGESTRPGAQPISADEERARVVPVIEALREKVDVPISIDTRKAQVARAALAAGAAMVNDVSALGFDPAMAEVVARAGVPVCLMHAQGTPETMQVDPRYGDVVAEVIERLDAAIARAREAGNEERRLLVDPGIGFGKTADHNVFLLRRLHDLRVLGRPIVLGTSRKAFLGKLTGKPAPERVIATAGSVAAAAVLGGADVVRVHDVAEVRDALVVADAVRLAQGGGQEFEPAPVRGRRAPR